MTRIRIAMLICFFWGMIWATIILSGILPPWIKFTVSFATGFIVMYWAIKIEEAIKRKVK